MAKATALGPYERKWAAKAEELEFTSLERVKTAAEKWATSIASITGIFGIVTLIKGPPEIAGLAPPYPLVVGVALLLSVTSALASIALAALAAQGVPEKLWNTALDTKSLYKAATKRAAAKLLWSRLAVVPAVLAMITAVGVTWFGARVPPKAPNFLVVSDAGIVFCGTLSSDLEGQSSLRLANGSPVALEHVAIIVTVSTCP